MELLLYTNGKKVSKNWKSPQHENKKRYDSAMNLGRMIIENSFGTLKNMWPILKHLNSKVDKTPKITIACCWLHNNFELWNQLELKVSQVATKDPFVGFGNPL